MHALFRADSNTFSLCSFYSFYRQQKGSRISDRIISSGENRCCGRKSVCPQAYRVPREQAGDGSAYLCFLSGRSEGEAKVQFLVCEPAPHRQRLGYIRCQRGFLPVSGFLFSSLFLLLSRHRSIQNRRQCSSY